MRPEDNMAAADNLSIMTKTLETKSGKNFSQLSAQEIEQIKKEISQELSALSALSAEDTKRNLRSLRFGVLHNTLLHLAVEFQNESDVALILQLAAGDREIIDARNADYFTAMHFAAINGNDKIASLLIEANANPNTQASEKRRKWTPIHYAAKFGNVKVLELLVFAGVSKETVTGFGLTPLVIAAEFGQVVATEFLLSIGANKNVITSEDNHCMNALHYGVVGNFSEVVKILLKAGINRNAETNSGFTALDFAAKSDNLEMVYLLLKWGAGDFEMAYQVAQKSDSKKSAELIKKYLQARRKVFDVKWLSQNESYLARMLNECTFDNVADAKIEIIDDVDFNPYGLFSLKQTFGFFSKVQKTFAEFACEKTATELPQAINNVKRVARIY